MCIPYMYLSNVKVNDAVELSNTRKWNRLGQMKTVAQFNQFGVCQLLEQPSADVRAFFGNLHICKTFIHGSC